MREKSLRRDHVRWQGWNRGVKLWDVFYIHMVVGHITAMMKNHTHPGDSCCWCRKDAFMTNLWRKGPARSCSGLYDLESNKSRV